MSIILAITETFSTAFYIIYTYCGISDMLDGLIARKSNNTSKIPKPIPIKHTANVFLKNLNITYYLLFYIILLLPLNVT